MASCCPHPGWPLCSATWGKSTLLYAVEYDGTGADTNARVCTLTSGHDLEKKSPSQCCFTPLLASSAICCHSPNTAVLNVGAAQGYQYDDMTVLCVSHNFLSLLWTSWPCSAPDHNAPHSSQSGGDDLASPALGRWVDRDRFILLPSCPLSWSGSSFSPTKQLS